MNSRTTFLIVILFFYSLGFSGDRVIYGEDNRKDYYQLDEEWQALADATVAIVSKGKLSKSDEVYTIKSQTLAEKRGLCKDEPFASQPSPGHCSGALIAPDLILTAGHCVRSQSQCQSSSFIFNHFQTKEEVTKKTFSENEVYQCDELLKSIVKNTEDWAIVRLKRPVENVEPIKLNESLEIPTTAELGVAGYPNGIPFKLAGGAFFREEKEKYFIANLDAFGGNSGSPVLNMETQEIEGVLVRGERDYLYDSAAKCRRRNICKENECRGEDVQKVEPILEFLETL